MWFASNTKCQWQKSSVITAHEQPNQAHDLQQISTIARLSLSCLLTVDSSIVTRAIECEMNFTGIQGLLEPPLASMEAPATLYASTVQTHLTEVGL